MVPVVIDITRKRAVNGSRGSIRKKERKLFQYFLEHTEMYVGEMARGLGVAIPELTRAIERGIREDWGYVNHLKEEDQND